MRTEQQEINWDVPGAPLFKVVLHIHAIDDFTRCIAEVTSVSVENGTNHQKYSTSYVLAFSYLKHYALSGC